MSATRTDFPFVIASLNSRRRWNKPAEPIVKSNAKYTIPSESPSVVRKLTVTPGPSKLPKPKTVARPRQVPIVAASDKRSRDHVVRPTIRPQDKKSFKEDLKTALPQRTSRPIRPRREAVSTAHPAKQTSKIPTKFNTALRAPVPIQKQASEPIARSQAPAKFPVVRPVKAAVLKSLTAKAPISPCTESSLSSSSSSDAKYSSPSTAATSPSPSPAPRKPPLSDKCESRGRIPAARFARPEGVVKAAAAKSSQGCKPAQKQSAATVKLEKARFSSSKAPRPPIITPARMKAPGLVAHMTPAERKPGSTQSPISDPIKEYLARLREQSAPAPSLATPALSFCSSAHSTPSEMVDTPVGVPRIRRLVIPALDKDRAVSRNEDIRREVDALRTQKRVAGGEFGLGAGEGISLKAPSIIHRVRRDAGKDVLTEININRNTKKGERTGSGHKPLNA